MENTILRFEHQLKKKIPTYIILAVVLIAISFLVSIYGGRSKHLDIRMRILIPCLVSGVLFCVLLFYKFVDVIVINKQARTIELQYYSFFKKHILSSGLKECVFRLEHRGRTLRRQSGIKEIKLITKTGEVFSLANDGMQDGGLQYEKVLEVLLDLNVPQV